MSFSEGLMDFGTGAFSGAATGAKISGGNPVATGLGGLALGTISYFGGASQRRLEEKNNRYALEGMEQDNQLGKLNVSETRRKVTADREKEKRKEMFGQMLAQYFQRQGGK